MKVETQELLRRDARIAAEGPGWGPTLCALALVVVAIFVLYRDTALSVVALWGSSDTYAHGYVIVPIALFLAWRIRGALAALAPAPDYLGFVLLAAAGLAWLVADAGQVQVGQQYALMTMIPAAVVAVAGRRVAWAAAFPLGFLLLAVPFGEAFLPRLMDWTADFTVAALQVTGIPVYREGTFFTVPSGQWSVIETCSGLRYVIASITVGALYAYLTYRHWWKRALFLVLSIAVPIFANFLRAYMIVMIGHLSSMRLAVGVDHFIYGWVFFGVVIGLLFWLGSGWRDVPQPRQERFLLRTPARAKPWLTAAAAMGVVVLGAAWPLYAQYLKDADPGRPQLAVPDESVGWTLQASSNLNWKPHYGGTTVSVQAFYRNGDRAVALYIGHYVHQRQGAELVGAGNRVAGEKDSGWVSMGESLLAQDATNGPAEVRETRLRSNRGRLLAWDWYRIARRDLSNPYLAKALLARDKLLGRGDASSAVVVAAPYGERPEEAAETLRLFMRDMAPAIRAVTDAAAKEGR